MPGVRDEATETVLDELRRDTGGLYGRATIELLLAEIERLEAQVRDREAVANFYRGKG